MIDWQHVQDLFLNSVDLPPAERARYLKSVCGDNAELLLELESLHAADQDSEELIEAAVQSEAASLFDSQVLIGERLGIYRIVREIGRGGMGSVYLALRDDQEYSKEVALKIVKRGMDTADVLERFRHERQILANLEHPYIARLFDGGSTMDGVPFFVMEYIEGRPVDVFCRQDALNVETRCELFIRILEAVAYAHRNLVVHRDLKPANILIMADGTPKLLDFGVAKLISGDPAALRTLTAASRPFTPGYASPEQVRGQPITTSTDIYSLGAILYELLSGEPAQKIEVHTPSEIERIVCDTEVPRPGLRHRGLSSDLDNIVLMAMRKEPERRYQSADQFAEDLRRHLKGRPVLARQDSLSYRASKFVYRNRIQVAVAAFVAVWLIDGLIVSLSQTHRAEEALKTAESQRLIAVHETALAESARLAESQQRTVADQQKVLADQQRDEAKREKAVGDQRVKDILALADRTLFDVHDAIATLPGSVSARRTLVKTTLEYLEKLEHQVGMDDELREALTAAYYKIAMIQGDQQGASLQDSQGAEQNLLKAEALLMPAYNRHPNDPGLMMRLIEVRSSLADLNYRAGHRQEAIKGYLDLLPVTQRLAAIKPRTLVTEIQQPTLENSVAIELLPTDPPQAMEHINHGIVLERDLISRYPDDESLKQGLGSLMAAGAGGYRLMGDLEKSGQYYLESIEAREELLRNNPNSNLIRRNLMIAYGNYAALLGIPWSPNLGRPDEARVYSGKAVSIAREMVEADPNNITARHDLGMSLSRLGMVDPRPDGTTASLASLEEAHSLIEPILVANAHSADTANQLALILEYEGHRQETLGRNDDAVASYRRSMAVMQPFLEQQNNVIVVQYISGEQNLALLYALMGRHADALEIATRSLARADKYCNAPPHTDTQMAVLAMGWSTLAKVQDKAGQMDKAAQSAETAMKAWSSVKRPDVLTAYSRAIADMKNLLKIASGQ